MAEINNKYSLNDSNTKVKCGTGWIMTQNDEDGLYYPFFVKVREVDIVWDMEEPTEEFKYATDQFGIDTSKMYRPGSKYVVTGRANGERYGKLESWVVSLYKDMTTEFQKRIILDRESCIFDESGGDKRFTVDVRLPFRVSASDLRNFSISITKNMNVTSDLDPLVMSTINTRLIEEYDETDIDRLNPFYSHVYIDVLSPFGGLNSSMLPASVTETQSRNFPYNLFFNMSGKVFLLNERSSLLNRYLKDYSDDK